LTQDNYVSEDKMSNQHSQLAIEDINRLPKTFVRSLFDTAILVATLIGAAYVAGVL